MADQLEPGGPMPFIFDIEGDRIYVGHPGERHADIQGKFTPGGIVEGVYDPKGNVQLRTDTDMPWSVYHLTRLWYSIHPELEIKHIYRLVGEDRVKLASSQSIAASCIRAFSADSLWEAAQQLKHLGSVYIAGESVKRIAQRQEIGSDEFQIVVQGVEPDELREIVSQYAGAGAMARVKFTHDMEGVNPFASVDQHLASAQRLGDAAVLVSLASGELIDPYHEVEQWIADAPFPLTLEQVLDPEWIVEDAYTASGPQKLYHITDRHNFTLDPNHEPHDNTLSIEDRSGRKGVYLTDNPDRWRANGYHRPYVAEIEVPEGLAGEERWHGEQFLPAEHFDKAQVRRVIPFDQHQREKYGEPGTIENYLGTPASTGDRDARTFTPEEHTEHLHRMRDYLHDVQGFGWNEFDEAGYHVGTDEVDGEGMPVRRDRGGNAMTRGRYAAKRGNILDPVHPTLSDKVFDNPADPEPTVKSEIISFVRSTIVDAMREAGWPDPEEHGYLSLVLTGSLTTFQYDDEGGSDFDVSLFIDAKRMPDWVRADLIKVMVEHVDGVNLPGTDIPLQAYCVPADISRDDLYKPGHRAGFDLDTGEWIVPPDPSMAKEVSETQKLYARSVVDKMKLLLLFAPEGAKRYWHEIHEKRRQSMREGGNDYNDANVAYKALANAGLFEPISKLTGEHIASVNPPAGHGRKPEADPDPLRVGSVPTAATPVSQVPFDMKTASVFKEAAWKDVQGKAVRLLRDGKVTMMANTPTYILGHVIGDHGEYETEISRHDPNSTVIEQWQCGCRWSQYAFQRTRKWKRLEGRPCSHVLALYWAAKSHPLDVSGEEEGYQVPRGQRVTPLSEQEQFDRSQGQIPGLTEQQADLGLDLDKLPRTFGPDDAPPPITDLPDKRDQIERAQPAQPTQPVGPIAPRPDNPFGPPKPPGKGQPERLRLFDITAPPGGQPVPPQNPTSIPGANPPGWQNPGNPTQFPGTYSSVDGVEIGDRVWVDVQLKHPQDPEHWVPAKVTDYIPDTEGEMWDEDDYDVEFDEVPEDLKGHVAIDGKTYTRMPESWIHREDERDA